MTNKFHHSILSTSQTLCALHMNLDPTYINVCSVQIVVASSPEGPGDEGEIVEEEEHMHKARE